MPSFVTKIEKYLIYAAVLLVTLHSGGDAVVVPRQGYSGCNLSQNPFTGTCVQSREQDPAFNPFDPTQTTLTKTLRTWILSACNVTLSPVADFAKSSIKFEVQPAPQPPADTQLCVERFDCIIASCVDTPGHEVGLGLTYFAGYWGGWVVTNDFNFSISNSVYPANGLLPPAKAPTSVSSSPDDFAGAMDAAFASITSNFALSPYIAVSNPGDYIGGPTTTSTPTITSIPSATPTPTVTPTITSVATYNSSRPVSGYQIINETTTSGGIPIVFPVLVCGIPPLPPCPGEYPIPCLPPLPPCPPPGPPPEIPPEETPEPDDDTDKSQKKRKSRFLSGTPSSKPSAPPTSSSPALTSSSSSRPTSSRPKSSQSSASSTTSHRKTSTPLTSTRATSSPLTSTQFTSTKATSNSSIPSISSSSTSSSSPIANCPAEFTAALDPPDPRFDYSNGEYGVAKEGYNDNTPWTFVVAPIEANGVHFPTTTSSATKVPTTSTQNATTKASVTPILLPPGAYVPGVVARDSDGAPPPDRDAARDDGRLQVVQPQGRATGADTEYLDVLGAKQPRTRPSREPRQLFARNEIQRLGEISTRDLVKRGCLDWLWPRGKNVPREYWCNCVIPGVEECNAQIRKHGWVGNLTSVFYTAWGGFYDGGQGPTLTKQWARQNLGACDWVDWDNMVNKTWKRITHDAIQKPFKELKFSEPKLKDVSDPFERNVCQAFGEQSAGEAYVVVPKGFPIKSDSVWSGYEYPALTRNPKVTRIWMVELEIDSLGFTKTLLWEPANGPSPQVPKGSRGVTLPKEIPSKYIPEDWQSSL